MDDNLQKYLKYKKKYLELKKLEGGFFGLDKMFNFNKKKNDCIKLSKNLKQLKELNKLINNSLNYINSSNFDIEEVNNQIEILDINFFYDGEYSNCIDIIKDYDNTIGITLFNLEKIMMNINNSRSINKYDNLENYMNLYYLYLSKINLHIKYLENIKKNSIYSND
jgi:hypothetical protein